MTQADRDRAKERRHDERWQKEMLEGLERLRQVMHDISDGVRELAVVAERIEKVAQVATPAPVAQDGPMLLSVKQLAEHLGVKDAAVRGWISAGKAPPLTRVGSRIMFQRADVDQWLAALRPEEEGPQPWRGSFVGGGIGRAFPSSTARRDLPWCEGSHTEPAAASKYPGHAVCRVCKDDYVSVNRDGRLRKHRARWW